MAYNATCLMCGATFRARRSDAKTCGTRCRKALSRSAVGSVRHEMSAVDFYQWNVQRIEAAKKSAAYEVFSVSAKRLVSVIE